MIYLLAVALILTVVGFALKLREKDWLTVIIEMASAIVLGFAAGIFIGIGARAGMWAIAFANGAESRFTVSGTLRVVVTFACLGIAFGLIYEGLLRKILRQSGMAFGLILTVCLWYPLGNSGAQILIFQPTAVSFLFFSFVLIALMFVPFSIVLERFLKRWHLWKENFCLLQHATMKNAKS